jgi:hypothetical protein
MFLFSLSGLLRWRWRICPESFSLHSLRFGQFLFGTLHLFKVRAIIILHIKELVFVSKEGTGF